MHGLKTTQVDMVETNGSVANEMFGQAQVDGKTKRVLFSLNRLWTWIVVTEYNLHLKDSR